MPVSTMGQPRYIGRSVGDPMGDYELSVEFEDGRKAGAGGSLE